MTRAKPADLPAPQISEVVDTDFTYVPVAPDQAAAGSKKRRRGRPKKFLPKTLTRRLVMGVVTLVLVLVSIVGTATYYSLKPFLRNQLNQQLGALANNSQSLTSIVSGNVTTSPTGGAVDIWMTIVNPDGSAVYTPQTSRSIHGLSLGAGDSAKLLSTPGRNRTVTTTDGRELAAESVVFTIGDAPRRYVLYIGLSTGGVHDTLRRLIRLELLLGIGAVVLAALLTSWGVRSEVGPLKRVTRTAQEVTAELGPDGAGLERRVPVPEASTEVGQVATSVNRLLETVQTEFNGRVASEERMRQFLADASHELRTPLTSIRGYAELSRLTGRINDPDDPISRIETEGTRMSRLVEDLLVLARGDQDSLTEHEPVQVDTVLSEAADVAASAHPERQINVRADTDAVVIGDHDQLVRLLVNLLNNAAVHTEPGGPIFLEGVRGYTDTGPAVALRVIDSGPGLAPEEAAHVFERFWRADKARSRVKGGSGLGMAIVAQIVDSHAGQVRFDSAVETGTTVTVTLPVAPVVQPPANSVQNPASTRQN